MESIVYSSAGNGALIVGDSFAENVLGNKDGSIMFGGEIESITDPDLSPENIFAENLEIDSIQVRVRNSIATGPSPIIVAFGNPETISVDNISRIMLLAGKREVIWVSPAGVSPEDMRVRFDLFTAQKMFRNLNVVLSNQVIDDTKTTQLSTIDFADIWVEVVDSLSDATRVVSVSNGCEESMLIPDSGEAFRERAIEFATRVVNSPSARYSDSLITSPYANPYPYNCSTFIAASYRYASDDQTRLVGFSDSQLWDMENIELIPWSEVQPGDIFYQKTMDDRFLGHVGMVLERDEFGGGTVIHSCGDDAWCANAPAYGMGYTDISRLSGSGLLAYPLDPSLANVTRKGNMGFTSDYTQAWYGRVKVPEASRS